MATLGKRIANIYGRNSVTAEQFRMIRANIKFVMKNNNCTTLLFTSPVKGEGKSTICSNLAISFAQEGKKILLVDADLRMPTVHYTFNKRLNPGLSDYLKESGRLFINSSFVDGLDIITAGSFSENPSELLDSALMENFLEEMKVSYDFVFLDAPPLLSISDAQILSAKVDGTILVTSSGKTEKKNLLKAKATLDASNANVVGVILNQVKLERNQYYNGYYGN